MKFNVKALDSVLSNTHILAHTHMYMRGERKTTYRGLQSGGRDVSQARALQLGLLG